MVNFLGLFSSLRTHAYLLVSSFVSQRHFTGQRIHQLSGRVSIKAQANEAWTARSSWHFSVFLGIRNELGENIGFEFFQRFEEFLVACL